MIKKNFRRNKPAFARPGKCSFCLAKTLPVYHETEVLARLITERGKIIPPARSGLCAKHQRRLAVAVKRARHLALLPFVNRI
ncbi:MAG: 30S ribosomal protein S18 [Candidatus Shapirobacteria bacterium]